MKRRRKKSPVPAVCSALGTVLLVALVLCCLPLTVPRMLGYGIYTVVSGSMEPAIPTGSLVYVESTEPEEAGEGDVIAFYSSPDSGEGGVSIITHRVVSNSTVMGQFITKGDANEKEDVRPVEYSQYIGKVTLSVPWAGRAAELFTSNEGKVLAVGVIVAALVLQIPGHAAKRKEKKRE